VTLTFSSWIPKFDKTVALWNKEHPDIQVKYSEVTSGSSGTYQNYSNQIKSGKTADLGFIEYDVLPTFKAQDGLRNFYDCAGVAGVQNDFVPAVWNQTSLGEKDTTYGLGMDWGAESLFYRKDLFEKAGIAIPKTWDEYYQAAKKIRALGGYIGNWDATGNFWPPMWSQAGANWFSQKDGTWKVGIDSPAGKQVADLVQKLYSEHLVSSYPIFQDEYSKALNTGKIWSQVGGPWATALIQTSAAGTAGKWAVAKEPTWSAGSGQVGVWGGASMAMFKHTKHPYEAAQFAIWATTSPEALALNNTNGGVYPPIQNVVSKLPAMQKGLPFYGGQAVFKDIEGWAADVNPSWIWGPTMVQVNADTGDQFGKVITGSQTVDAALRALQSKTLQTMSDQGISVSK
jgi:multiple sugar transport system substrate-binding protein